MYRYYFFKSTKKLIVLEDSINYNMLNHNVGIENDKQLTDKQIKEIGLKVGAYYYKKNNSGYKLINKLED